MATIPVETDRLVLRLHISSDRESIRSTYSKTDVARFLLDEPWTNEDADRNIAKRLLMTGLDGDSGALALVVELEGRPVGGVMAVANRS